MTFDQFLREAAPPEELSWRKYRRRSARHRVERRMSELGIDGFASYLGFLRSSPRERAGLADLMRVTMTRLFREREEWQYLAERVLPVLVSENPIGSVQAWSAGCCGGEEPYSLAMVWLEQVVPTHPAARIHILASDIDEPCLERAAAGCYDGSSLREVPRETRRRFFRREGSRWCLDDDVKRLVQFERRNIMTDPVPPPVDLVLCRYLVFTYYQGERLRAATRRLWEALRPGGVLMTARKEHLPETVSLLFEPWPGTPHFYRRNG